MLQPWSLLMRWHKPAASSGTRMEKRKITAREVIQDIRAGKSDQALMQKYSLSARGLQSLFDKLVRAGAVTQRELDDRVPVSEQTVDLSMFVCPACGNIQGKEFVTCPRCGFTVPGGAQSTQKESVKRQAAKQGPTLGKQALKAYSADSGSASVRENGANMQAGLAKMVAYCRMLSIAAVVTYSVAVIGLLFVSVRSSGSGIFESLIGVMALGVPAVAISGIVFVTLRVLTEAVKIFSSVSGPLLGGPAGGKD
jgi:hypothetical protein